jgi:hypothetical protein
MRRPSFLVCILLTLVVARTAQADSILIDRQPDSLDNAAQLDGFTGAPGETFTVAGNFVFSGATGTLLRTVGMYMQSYGDGSTPFSFLVFGSSNGTISPDPLPLSSGSAALFPPQTGAIPTVPGPDFDPDNPLSLSLVSAPLDRPVSLVNGLQYWIAATTLPFAGPGSYLIGLTGNPSGTIALSSDLTGTTFSYLPGFDLDIYAAGDIPVPEPATFGLVAAGAALLVLERRRRMHAARTLLRSVWRRNAAVRNR